MSPMRNLPGYAVILAMIVLSATPGCRKTGQSGSGSQPAQQPQAAAPVAQVPDSPGSAVTESAARLDQVIALWVNGDEAGAEKLFLSVDWSKGNLLPPDSPLMVSEQQVAAMPEPKRSQTVSLMLDRQKPLREISRALLGRGDDAVSAKDYALARQCYTAVGKLGDLLGGPNNAKITQLVGQSLRKKADAGLANLPKE